MSVSPAKRDRLPPKRMPCIICKPDPLSDQQSGRLRFRSHAWTDQAPRMLNLAAGVREVYQDHLALFQKGWLPGHRNR